MLSILIPNHNELKVVEFVDKVAKEFPTDQVIVAVDREGKGKGWALREALKEARGDVVAFIDADGDIEPRMLLRLLPFLQDYDVVVGSKCVYQAPIIRKVVTHLSRLYIRLMFGISVDTQTGLKLFRRDALPDWETDGYAFDIEILAQAVKAKKAIIEIPIAVSIKKQMSRKALWNTFIESLKIRFFLS